MNATNFQGIILPMYGAVVLAIVLTIVILGTVVGNLLVFLAIILDRDLKRPQNYLILSLAIADLMVGLFVLPIAAIKEVLSNQWIFGEIVCDLWTSLDVLICTASILHLVAIALDRYWSIMDVVYSKGRTAKKIIIMILIVWTVAALTSFGPLVGWKDAGYKQRIERMHCLLSQDLAYQIYATATAFYVPLVLIIILYYKIYRAAKERLNRQKEKKRSRNQILNLTNAEAPRTRFTTVNGVENEQMSSMIVEEPLENAFSPDNTPQISTKPPVHKKVSDLSTSILDEHKAPRKLSQATITVDGPSTNVGRSSQLFKRKSRSKDIDNKRERKAFTTLAIVTGTFVCSWLPFFVMALVRPFCPTCHWSPILDSFLGWLGYVNSLMNPLIYTTFSPDFRQAFHRIIKRVFKL